MLAILVSLVIWFMVSVPTAFFMGAVFGLSKKTSYYTEVDSAAVHPFNETSPKTA